MIQNSLFLMLAVQKYASGCVDCNNTPTIQFEGIHCQMWYHYRADDRDRHSFAWTSVFVRLKYHNSLIFAFRVTVNAVLGSSSSIPSSPVGAPKIQIRNLFMESSDEEEDDDDLR